MMRSSLAEDEVGSEAEESDDRTGRVGRGPFRQISTEPATAPTPGPDRVTADKANALSGQASGCLDVKHHPRFVDWLSFR